MPIRDYSNAEGRKRCRPQPHKAMYKGSLPVGQTAYSASGRFGGDSQTRSPKAEQRSDCFGIQTGPSAVEPKKARRFSLKKIPYYFAVSLIYTYRAVLGPYLGGACRFYPSCSQYALDAFARYGFWKATFKTLTRLGKCHPFHPGGYDPA